MERPLQGRSESLPRRLFSPHLRRPSAPASACATQVCAFPWRLVSKGYARASRPRVLSAWRKALTGAACTGALVPAYAPGRRALAGGSAPIWWTARQAASLGSRTWGRALEALILQPAAARGIPAASLQVQLSCSLPDAPRPRWVASRPAASRRPKLIAYSPLPGLLSDSRAAPPGCRPRELGSTAALLPRCEPLLVEDASHALPAHAPRC